MKESENIDDIFSNALDNFGVEPPTNLQDAIAETRNNIEPENGNNNKNYFLIIIAAMAILFTALFFTSTDEQKLADAKEKLKAKNETEKNTNSSNNSEPLNKSNESKSEAIRNENTRNDNKRINKTNVSKNSLTHSETVVDEYVKPISNNEAKKSNSTPHKKTKQSNVKSLHINNNRDFKLQEPTQNDNGNNNGNSNEKLGNPISLETKNFNSENNKAEKDSNETIVNKSSDSLQSQSLKADTINATAANDSYINSATVNAPLAIKDTSKTSQKLVWFIEPLAGIYSSQNKFVSNNTIAINQLKDSIKTSQPIYNYGINVGVQKNRFTIKSGLTILQWKEQLGYSYSSQKYVTSIGDSIIINGTDTIVKHNIPVEVLTNVHAINNNKTSYTYLQIPLFIGYTLPLKKLELNVGLGVVYNLLLKSKGNYKDFTNDKLIDYSNKKDSPLNNYFISSQLSVGALFKVNSKLKICLYVPYSLGLQSIYKSAYTVNRKLNTVGLQLGFRYDL